MLGLALAGQALAAPGRQMTLGGGAELGPVIERGGIQAVAVNEGHQVLGVMSPEGKE